MQSKTIPYVKLVVHILCLTPFAYLLILYRSGVLASYADPVNYITHFTGDWAIWLLMVTLAVTPVRRLHPGLGWLVRLRRMIGLYCFFYATLHLATYVFLFSGYDMTAAIAGVREGRWGEPFKQFKAIVPTMLDDAAKRRFIQIGLFAWLILLSLALTSTQYAIRTMGGYVWGRLHRWIYVAGVAAVVHYWWLVKAGVRTPWKVTVVLTVLLLWRVAIASSRALRSWKAAKAAGQKKAVGELGDPL